MLTKLELFNFKGKTGAMRLDDALFYQPIVARHLYKTFSMSNFFSSCLAHSLCNLIRFFRFFTSIVKLHHEAFMHTIKRETERYTTHKVLGIVRHAMVILIEKTCLSQRLQHIIRNSYYESYTSCFL